jgi:hypothetical protein
MRFKCVAEPAASEPTGGCIDKSPALSMSERKAAADFRRLELLRASGTAKRPAALGFHADR